MNTFERLESQVRSYSRSFPVVFVRAKGPFLWDEEGVQYLDFFAGAGTMNYGHNNPLVSQALIEYIQKDGILHSLDKYTAAKRDFLEAVDERILRPRKLKYRVQFCGPTGTNAVEAALKLARKVRGRRGVVAFTNAYHGHSLGALSVTGNVRYKNPFSGCGGDVTFMPYDGYLGKDLNTAEILLRYLDDPSSGVGVPAAVILETIQAEGGINVASVAWLKEIEQICHDFNILLIVDDIQVGNGRSGHFFSFERAGIVPDLVVLSKAIGGGMPLSLLLINPDIDIWNPGEHTGTFRGNNLAFVAGATLLNHYWQSSSFAEGVRTKAELLRRLAQELADRSPHVIKEIRGLGMIVGIVTASGDVARKISREAFQRGLIAETAGSEGQVVKLLPPLVTDEEILRKGMSIISDSVDAVASVPAVQLTKSE